MKEINGDLIALAREGRFDLIAHGCNCFCTMGAGIAKGIRSVFPAPIFASGGFGRYGFGAPTR